MTENPMDLIIDAVQDHLSEGRTVLPGPLAQTATALALIEISASLRTIATATKGLDEHGITTYPC